MSQMMRVIVLCPKGRRETISVSPNSSILQILEEACRKQNLNPDDFDVCHYNKRLDLTVPVRFASLPNNAQLELKPVANARQEKLVSIALQLESGERIMNEFKPSVSMLEVIEQSLGSKSLEEFKERGELVCIYMRQKLIGEEIKNTTLRSLGLTKGSAIIRLSVISPETTPEPNVIVHTAFTTTSILNPESAVQTKPNPTSLVTDASEEVRDCEKMECDPPPEKHERVHAHTPDTFNHPAPPAKADEQSKVVPSVGTSTGKVESLVSQKEKVLPFSGKGVSLKGEVTNDKKAISKTSDKDKVSDSVEDSSESEEDIGTIHYIGGRHAVIYSLDDITEVKKADLPDEFFELTIEDMKYLMEQYKKARLELENKPLLTQELRNRQLLKRLGRYKQTVIRVIFPERLVLQAVFDSSETVMDVQEFIKEFLEDKSSDFYLYTAPPKEKLDPSKSLIESLLIPAAVTYFGCNKHLSSYLLRTLRDKISDPRAAAVAAHESRQQAVSSDAEDLMEDTEEILPDNLTVFKAPGPSSVETASKPKSSEKVPKWLKLSKK